MRIAIAALAAVIALPAAAVGRLADVKVIDRDTGQTLPVHHHRGEYWVAGRPGAHYAIYIQSRDATRLLAVTSVDGINVVTGETAGHHQRGYVFDAWQGYDIAGWRKSGSEIAAFTFTSIPRSYAAQTGRPDHVGVIGVALFREKERMPAVSLQQRREPSPPPANATGTRSSAAAEVAAEADAGAARKMDRAREQRAPSLGTGHGRREHSQVTQVPFERARSRPDEVIRIRYDSRANLVAMGVIPQPRPLPRPAADPFPDSRLGYVPDP